MQAGRLEGEHPFGGNYPPPCPNVATCLNVSITIEISTSDATTLSLMNFSGYVEHVTIFSWKPTTAYCLAVGLGLGLGLDLVSSSLAVMLKYLYYFRLSLSHCRRVFCWAYLTDWLFISVYLYFHMRRIISSLHSATNKLFCKITIILVFTLYVRYITKV